MGLATLIFLSLLSQGPDQTATSTAAVAAGGHTYQLFCASAGELIHASDTGLCTKGDSDGVQRFEIRNENGDVQFSQDSAEGKPFGFVAIFRFRAGEKEILDVDTSLDGAPGGGPKSEHTNYYFDPTANGLVRFGPALVGIDGFAQLGNAAALSKTFDAGFVQFSVLLGFNLLTHRIEFLADQPAFSAFPPHNQQKPGASPASGAVKLFAAHDVSASATDVKILPGHTIAWWQSTDIAEKPASGQVVEILAAWAPISLKPADNAPEGVDMVYYDWNNLWLQIEVDGHTGWIRGASSLRTLGLSAAQH